MHHHCSQPPFLLLRGISRGFVAVLAVGLMTAPAAPSFGQSAPPKDESFEDAVEVRVVEVEVWVQRRNGEPVTGLGRDDFQLIVDGKDQAIEYFETARGDNRGQPRPEVGDPQTPIRKRKPSYLAVYLDRHFLEDGDFKRLKNDLSRFLRQGLQPEDQILLATANEELEVLEPFTVDRERIIEQIAKLGGAPDGGKLAGDFRAILRDLRSEQSARSTTSISFGRNDQQGGQRIRKQSPESYLSEIEAFHRESAGEMRFVAEQLLELIYTLSGLPGNKQVLYVGGPLPTDHAKILFETWRDVFERSQKEDDFNASNSSEVIRSQQAAMRVITRYGDFLVGTDMFREVATSAGVSGVTFHTLGLSSLRRSRNVLASRSDVEIGSVGQGISTGGITDTRASLAMDDGMRTLALLTGGRHLEGRSKFDQFLDHLGSDLRSRYVLGFTATPDSGGEPHKVEVKLSDSKLARRYLVRNRESFLVKTHEVELAERTLAALMIDEPDDNPLGVEISIRVPEARVEGWVVEISVRVPTGALALIPDRDTHAGQLTIFATAGKLGSELAPVMKARVPLRFSDQDLETALKQKVEYVFELDTPRDPGRVSVTVRDEFGPTESTLTSGVTPPEDLGTDRGRRAPRVTAKQE